MTEQEKIDAGQRVKRFLEDPAVREALERMEKKNYAEFKAAQSLEDVRSAKARSDVLETFAGELQGVVFDAEMAKRELERKEQQREALERARGASRRK